MNSLRQFIKEVLKEEKKKYHFGGSQPEESYEDELLDDPDYTAPSVYVPNDIKKKINKWASDMGLHTSKKRK